MSGGPLKRVAQLGEPDDPARGGLPAAESIPAYCPLPPEREVSDFISVEVHAVNVLPLKEAALALGLSVKQVRDRMAAGWPVRLRGRRGRGHKTYISLWEWRAWEASAWLREGGPQMRRARREAILATCPAIEMVLARHLKAPELQPLRGELWLESMKALRDLASLADGAELPPIQRPENN